MTWQHCKGETKSINKENKEDENKEKEIAGEMKEQILTVWNTGVELQVRIDN